MLVLLSFSAASCALEGPSSFWQGVAVSAAGAAAAGAASVPGYGFSPDPLPPALVHSPNTRWPIFVVPIPALAIPFVPVCHPLWARGISTTPLSFEFGELVPFGKGWKSTVSF